VDALVLLAGLAVVGVVGTVMILWVVPLLLVVAITVTANDA
jgi:hypothetical protein